MVGLTFDREKVSFNLAKLKKGSDVFEIVVNPDLAVEARKNEKADIREVLLYPKVFSDAKKGMAAPENRMQAVFNTIDPYQVAWEIIKHGEIQLTTEYRRKVLEAKKRKIVDMIHRQGVDPRTHAPHPVTRIENAFEEAKIRVDEFRDPESQLQEIIKQLRPILPIQFEVKEIELRIPAVHAAKSYSAVKSFGKIIREDWLQDGSWKAVIEIPGGMEDEFYNKLNSITHGEAEAKRISAR